MLLLWGCVAWLLLCHQWWLILLYFSQLLPTAIPAFFCFWKWNLVTMHACIYLFIFFIFSLMTVATSLFDWWHVMVRKVIIKISHCSVHAVRLSCLAHKNVSNSFAFPAMTSYILNTSYIFFGGWRESYEKQSSLWHLENTEVCLAYNRIETNSTISTVSEQDCLLWLN